ncbi:MAG: electron transfer flavoprotein subunit beta/FixA family protein [Sphaerobacter sp.]|nr:electron transfer flavoprotein subunit beta/FixA family protein [Sphaerobacter sp.]
MKIVVLVKQVPDPNAVRFDPRTGDIQSGTPQVANEYDLHAMEAAIQLKERRDDVELVAVSLGQARETLNRCLAMGADRAVAIEDATLAAGDSTVTARALAALLRAEGFDLLLAGQETSDGGTGTVGPQLAALLDVPVVSNVVALEERDGVFVAQREIEDGRQVLEVTPPAILCALSGLNEPRYPSLKGIMAARRKPTETKTAADLGLSAAEAQARVTWGPLFQEEETAEGIILRDVDADSAVDQLVAFLQERKLI